MGRILNDWNRMERGAAIEALLNCCAAARWADGLLLRRPYGTEVDLYQAADRVWATMEEPDWLQAFAAHPRIGEKTAQAAMHASLQSSAWSRQEQAAVETTSATMLDEMAEKNRLYEERFGFTYIVCANGKSIEAMLTILDRRLANDRERELREAAEQQREIMQIRLRKWLEA